MFRVKVFSIILVPRKKRTYVKCVKMMAIHDGKGGKMVSTNYEFQITSVHKGRMAKMSSESRKGMDDANASEMKYSR